MAGHPGTCWLRDLSQFRRAALDPNDLRARLRDTYDLDATRSLAGRASASSLLVARERGAGFVKRKAGQGDGPTLQPRAEVRRGPFTRIKMQCESVYGHQRTTRLQDCEEGDHSWGSSRK